MKEKILKALKESNGGYISGEKLSDILGVSRTAIWKHINSLREEGYDILSVPRKGYVLNSCPDLLTEIEIQEGLNTKCLGRKVVYLDRVNSTNDIAKDLAIRNEEEGLVILAEQQVKGRGRKGRAWASPKGAGIWMSLLLRPNILPIHGPKFTLLAAVAVAKSIREETGLDIQIKWPNDLVLQERKVCGILSEMNIEIDTINYIVIGIGINVNIGADEFPKELHNRMISLSQVKGEKVSRQHLVKRILENMEKYYFEYIKELHFDRILEEWKQLSCNIGRQVKAVYQGREIIGKAMDLSKDGALIVEQEDGERIEISYGEVSVRGIDQYV